jgi:hypothetical protein
VKVPASTSFYCWVPALAEFVWIQADLASIVPSFNIYCVSKVWDNLAIGLVGNNGSMKLTVKTTLETLTPALGRMAILKETWFSYSLSIYPRFKQVIKLFPVLSPISHLTVL